MDTVTAGPTLEYPFPAPPDGGTVTEVAAGVFWVRMPLPFKLDHINLYLLRDGDGWTLVDTGINLPNVRELWPQILEATLGGRPLTRLIVTHMHPDHVGLAGWLADRTGASLWMSQGEYLAAQNACMGQRDSEKEKALRRSFYAANGMPAERLELFETHRGSYSKIVWPLPAAFHRLRERDPVIIDGASWEVIFGFGHAPEHVSLFCAERGILIAGDQVLPKITTNVSVWPNEPNADPLRWFLETIDRFRPLPDETLVLPSHGLPFRRLQLRLDQLEEHHDERLDALVDQIAERGGRGITGVEAVPVLFPRELDDHQFVFALGETLAHLHCLESRGRVSRSTDAQGIHRFAAA